MEDDEALELLIPKTQTQQTNCISTIQIIPLPCLIRYFCCCINHHLMTRDEYGLFISLQHQTRIKYNKSLQEHEDKLNKFNEECRQLLPEKQMQNEVLWKSYGFQTNEPRNDFRDGGIHSLDFMFYFIEEHQNEAKELFLIEQFGFATTAIELLENGTQSPLTRKGLKVFLENYMKDNRIESEVMKSIKNKLRHVDKDKILYNNVVNNMMSNMIIRGINICGEALNNKTDSELILRLRNLLK